MVPNFCGSGFFSHVFTCFHITTVGWTCQNIAEPSGPFFVAGPLCSEHRPGGLRVPAAGCAPWDHRRRRWDGATFVAELFDAGCAGEVSGDHSSACSLASLGFNMFQQLTCCSKLALAVLQCFTSDYCKSNVPWCPKFGPGGGGYSSQTFGSSAALMRCTAAPSCQVLRTLHTVLKNSFSFSIVSFLSTSCACGASDWICVSRLEWSRHFVFSWLTFITFEFSNHLLSLLPALLSVCSPRYRSPRLLHSSLAISKPN